MGLLIPEKDQLQNQTANTKKVNENEEQAMEPLLEKLRFLYKGTLKQYLKFVHIMSPKVFIIGNYDKRK